MNFEISNLLFATQSEFESARSRLHRIRKCLKAHWKALDKIHTTEPVSDPLPFRFAPSEPSANFKVVQKRRSGRSRPLPPRPQPAPPRLPRSATQRLSRLANICENVPKVYEWFGKCGQNIPTPKLNLAIKNNYYVEIHLRPFKFAFKSVYAIETIQIEMWSLKAVIITPTRIYSTHPNSALE